MTSLHKQYRPAFVLAGYFWQAAMSWKVEEEKKKKSKTGMLSGKDLRAAKKGGT